MCDSIKLPTQEGICYFLISIDDFSWYCHMYLLKSKDEVSDNFKICKAKTKIQTKENLKNLCQI